ncbi:hypothetical protein L9F63_011169, partial [Diploptera punctata]
QTRKVDMKKELALATQRSGSKLQRLRFGGEVVRHEQARSTHAPCAVRGSNPFEDA